jgi:hypothetical protein
MVISMRHSWWALLLALALVVPGGTVLAQNSWNQTDDDDDEPANATPNATDVDLEVDDIELVPDDPQRGDNVTFVVTIENDGDDDASPFNVSASLDDEQVVDERVPGLEADASIEVASDAWNATEGEHEIAVTVDADDEVDETDEDNTETESFEIETADDEDESDEAGDGDDVNESDDDRRERPESSWSVENDTYEGEHVRFVADDELPGITDYELLPEQALVFETIALPGANATHHAVRDLFNMETEEDHELAVRDVDQAWLTAEADDDASLSLEVADGVDVSLDERYSDEDDRVYELAVNENKTLYLTGDNLAYDNGTFEADEVHLTDEFPPSQDEREPPEEREDRFEQRREAGSQYQRDNSTFTGEHVKLTANTSLPGVEDYALIGSTIPVFDQVDLTVDEAAKWRAHGKQFQLRTDDARIEVLDVPPSVMVVRAGENAATIDLADDVEIQELNRSDDEDGQAYRLSLAENRTAWLVGDEISHDNATVTVEDRAIFRAAPTSPEASENQGPGSMPDEAERRGPPEEGDEDADDEEGPPDERGPPEQARVHQLDNRAAMAVEEAAATGKIGVEVHAGANASNPVAMAMNENIQVKKAWAQDQSETKAGLTIEAPDDAPGTTVTMNLDEEQLGNVSIDDAGDKLEVEFDNETIRMADDLDDVLNPEDDDDAEYLLLVGSDKVQVLVSVPHFSPHTIEVTEASTQSSGEATANGAPGFTLPAVVAALGTTAIAVRQRK